MPAISSNKPYRIGRSRTGLGLFATKPIKKGARIIRYFGPMLDCNKEEDDSIENKYLFQITKRWTIDGSVRENVARYINHACRPNCYTDVVGRAIWIIAARRIEEGEELTYDYNTDGVAGIPCQCRPRCRRVL